jgi:hypothetical protein
MVLLYIPFNFQRRLTLGLFFPLAGLAALGLDRMVRGRVKFRAVFILLMILSLPSNLIVIFRVNSKLTTGSMKMPLRKL